MDEKTKEKQKKIIELTSSFCDDKLDEEYKNLSIKLIEKMGRKHEIPFKRGRLDIWASAVVYALGQINFLFDKSHDPYISASELCDYFGTKQSTVSDKARLIRNMFNMKHFDNEFSTKSISKIKEDAFADFNKSHSMSKVDILLEEAFGLIARGKLDEAWSILNVVDEDNPEYFKVVSCKFMILALSDG